MAIGLLSRAEVSDWVKAVVDEPRGARPGLEAPFNEVYRRYVPQSLMYTPRFPTRPSSVRNCMLRFLQIPDGDSHVGQD
jgi:hypothetical protein